MKYEVTEGGAWSVLKLPAERDGKYLWEDFYGRKYYEEAKKDPRSWACIYQQDPMSGFEGPWFADIPFLTYTEPVKPGKLPAIMVVDPGLSKRRSGDPTSIMILCGNSQKKILVADWTLDHLDPDERTFEIIRLIKRWSVRRVLYEEYGLNADTFHLGKALKNAGIYLRPIPVGRSGGRHNLSKDERIRSLITDFRDGIIIFPEEMKNRLTNGETMDLVRYFREQEYLLYAGEGSTLHDEGLDTLARTHEPEFYMNYPDDGSETEDEGDYVEHGGGLGWEAQY